MKRNWTSTLSLLLALMLLAALMAACGAQGGTAPVEPVADGEEVDLPDGEGIVADIGPLLDEAVPLADGPLLGTMLNVSASGTLVKENASAVIDYPNTKDGYVMVKWTGERDAKIKVLLKGPSGTTYQYNLRTDGQYDAFPFSDGNGAYKVGVYKNTSGTKYSTTLSVDVTVAMTDEFAPFIRPNQYVNYNPDSAVVKKAAEICADATGNLQKVDKVYAWVVSRIVYDYDKAATVQSGYLPNVDEILSTRKGICFDYAALMSAMLRSQNVPVKLVVGYTGNVYHAWISVYSETEGWIEGKIYFNGKEWKLMDPTFAAGSKGSAEVQEYIGNGANYTSKYLY